MLLENSNTEKVVKRLNELLLQDPLEMALIDKVRTEHKIFRLKQKCYFNISGL